ncbi:MAG: serine hydrolase, partial [Ruminococcus sp.]|nr:serine hydrolase [Ruminococcus sp.]
KESVQVANKTGENDKSQHDIGIVYGARTDYILCVMSENAGKEADAVSNIQRISAMAYYYLN